MCGITGVIDFTCLTETEVLEKMTGALHHRGPDGMGTRLFKTDNYFIGLGHARLSVIDLTQAASQPMTYDRFWITFNGEIYNFNEVKLKLTDKGHSFSTHSDTEVILHAYQEWGLQCVDNFIGMFAFVIYDSEKEEIICFRDRAGVKPFFYYWDEKIFLFSSELKAFHQHPQFSKEINIDSVAAFMQYGNIPTPGCIFKNAFKLKPGHSLSLNLKSKSVSVAEYWNVYTSYNKPKLEISFEEAKLETENLLNSAFRYRMVSDVPVGVFLSGGYDSACLAALLQKGSTTPLKTFTIGVPDIGLDEAPYAKKLAKYLGTDHQEFYCTQKEALELIKQLPYYYDEPFGDQSAIPTTLVCSMARKDVTVALSADGGDELFAGYNRYDYLMRQGQFLNKMPGPILSVLSGAMKKVPANNIPVLRNKYNFTNRYEKLKMILNDPSPKNVMLSLSQQFSDEDIGKLFSCDVKTMQTAFVSEELKKEFHTPLSYMLAIDYQTYLLDDILQKVDRASMSCSLEAREPYLDQRLIEWAAMLPDNFKYHKGTKKYILREIVHKHIPREMMERPKMGFAIPIEDWLTNDLKEQVSYYFNEKRIKEQGIFNYTTLNTLYKDFYSGRRELALKIWYAFMFQMWWDRWMV